VNYKGQSAIVPAVLYFKGGLAMKLLPIFFADLIFFAGISTAGMALGKCEKGHHYDTHFARCLPLAKEQAKVSVQGTLKTGVVAIGGESTGFVLKTLDGEMDILFAKEDRPAATLLDGKQVHIEGMKFTEKGLERKERTIIAVTKFMQIK
jgi:hypothetical protein